MTAYNPKLGDIVSICSHPFSENNSDVVITGEHQLLPPLMVVAEILKDAKTQFDDKSGDEISRIGLSQCKCLWFSHKTFLFEEVWLSSKYIKVIKTAETILDKDSLIQLISIDGGKDYDVKTKVFFNVNFKTNELELGKRKSSITFTDNSNSEKTEEKHSITACLFFVSPVMEIIQIIEAKDLESKEGKFNIKTGEKRRTVSDWAVKCKWFNPLADKFSEKILPICVLDKVIPVNQIVIDQVKNSIGEKIFFLYQHQDGLRTILKPTQLLYKSGSYLLRVFDLVLNRQISINVPTKTFDQVNKYRLDSFPKFDFISSGIYSDLSVTDEVKAAVDEALTSNYYIRIVYQSKSNKISKRTLKNYHTHTVIDKDENPIHYIIGFCMSSQEERTFKVSEISKLEVLDLEF